MVFSNITEKLNYPKKYKSKLSTVHSEVINYAIAHFQDNTQFKKILIECLNVASYLVLTNSTLPKQGIVEYLLERVYVIPEDDIQDVVADLYIQYRSIKWDLQEVESVKKQDAVVVAASFSKIADTAIDSGPPTPKEALYVKLPSIPQFDINDMWLSTAVGQYIYQIPKTLPAIPTVQAEVSATTNPDAMTAADLLKLFPDHLIRTRNPLLYERVDSIEYDDELGCIIPIDGFTSGQVRDNIIKYPHIFQVKKLIDGKCKGFYSTLEVDGDLHDILSVWDTLPESKLIPKKSEWIKEYIVRRYLLERDIKHIKHKYPMYGELQPFLTLFAPPEFYKDNGYTDMVELARDCVKSRVQYKQSMNPIIAASKIGAYCNQNFCPYTGHCIKPECTMACVEYGEMTYLLERNGIEKTNSVFNRSPKILRDGMSVLHESEGKLTYLVSDHVKETSDLLSYLAICENWYGNRLHCCVYHLDFYKFLEQTQKSWSMTSMPDDLEYSQIWMNSAKILVISNFEFVQFKDFQAQTMLNIINSRMNDGKTTILVGPPLASLVGVNGSVFFARLRDMLGKAVHRT